MGMFVTLSSDLPAGFGFWQAVYLVVITQAACRLVFGALVLFPGRVADTKMGFCLIGIPAVLGALSCHPLGWVPVGLMFILAPSAFCMAGSLFAAVVTLLSMVGMANSMLRTN